jgi:hypothetical protein
MDDDIIDLHCGRCGRPMQMRIVDLRDRRIIGCESCERSLRQGAPPPGGAATRAGAVRILLVSHERRR